MERAEAALRDQAQKQAEDIVPPWLRPYAFVAGRQQSTHLPDVSNLPYNTAYYLGRAVGQAGDGSTLDGIFKLGFGLDGADYYLDGVMEFGLDTISFHGGVPDSSRALFLGAIDSGTLSGGTVSEGTVQGGFFGPSAEQVGGAWRFSTTGGSRPGDATGSFAGAQHETQ